MSEADNELKRDLECLRLAADLMQLSRDAVNPELKAHCIQMASYWTDQVDASYQESTADCPGWAL